MVIIGLDPPPPQLVVWFHNMAGVVVGGAYVNGFQTRGGGERSEPI